MLGGAVFSALALYFSIFERLLLKPKAMKRKTTKNVFRRKMLENYWIKECYVKRGSMTVDG